MSRSGNRFGIIAGSGYLPLHIARYQAGRGRDVYVAALHGSADRHIEGPAWETAWYELNSLRELVDGLKKAGVSRVALAGGVSHATVFRKPEFDDMLGNLLRELPDHRASTILGGLVNVLTEEGFQVQSLADLAEDLLPPRGLLAGPPPTSGQEADLEMGWGLARKMADLDVGQTVIIKGRSVVAVEAMEGTDEAIRRAGVVAGGDLAVVKLAATDHDFRFDVPTVGPATVDQLSRAGSGLLAVEAGRCFLLHREKLVVQCDRLGLTLLSCVEDGAGRVHWGET